MIVRSLARGTADLDVRVAESPLGEVYVEEKCA